NQAGLNATPAAAGAVDVNITKTVGRSYSYAWENANKGQPVNTALHISAPSPSTQYVQYSGQNGVILLVDPGTVRMTTGSSVVVGTGTAVASAWIGRRIWFSGGYAGALTDLRIVSVQDATHLTVSGNGSAFANVSGLTFAIYDPQATHVRLYQTADG